MTWHALLPILLLPATARWQQTTSYCCNTLESTAAATMHAMAAAAAAKAASCSSSSRAAGLQCTAMPNPVTQMTITQKVMIMTMKVTRQHNLLVTTSMGLLQASSALLLTTWHLGF